MKKTLVADDELDIRNLTKIILEENGYQVSLTANGTEALQKAESELARA
jgi:CheY-like chemotaxis protein